MQHSKQRAATNDYEIEPVHSRHRRRHSSRTRVKTKTILGDTIDSTCEDDRALASKSKGRRHLYKEIERLMEENRLITAKLEEAEASGNIFSLKKFQSNTRERRSKEFN